MAALAGTLTGTGVCIYQSGHSHCVTEILQLTFGCPQGLLLLNISGISWPNGYIICRNVYAGPLLIFKLILSFDNFILAYNASWSLLPFRFLSLSQPYQRPYLPTNRFSTFRTFCFVLWTRAMLVTMRFQLTTGTSWASPMGVWAKDCPSSRVYQEPTAHLGEMALLQVLFDPRMIVDGSSIFHF